MHFGLFVEDAVGCIVDWLADIVVDEMLLKQAYCLGLVTRLVVQNYLQLR